MTAAPGTTAPEGSVTRPVTSPNVCAYKEQTEKPARAVTTSSVFKVRSPHIISSTWIGVYYWLPGHLPVRVFPPDFGGLLAGGANHDSFLDHVDDIRGIHRIQEEDLIRFTRRKNPCARRLHSGIAFCIGTQNAERQTYVTGTPLGKRDSRLVRIGLGILLPLLETTLRAGMRAGVINRLSLREQFDRWIDSLCLRYLDHSRGDRKRYKEHTNHEAPDKLLHGFLFNFFEKLPAV
jgi:hypothetical protein